MVNVAGKANSERLAHVYGEVAVSEACLAQLNQESVREICSVARIAGIQGAKYTASLIPLCHPISLDQVEVSIELDHLTKVFTIGVTSRSHGQTGVEMEAFCAAQVAGLTIYDMIKAVDPGAIVGPFRLLEKQGGKNGPWIGKAPKAPPIEQDPNVHKSMDSNPKYSVEILVTSDRASQGVYEDKSGPVARKWIEKIGLSGRNPIVIPDESDALRNHIEICVKEQMPLVLVCGGTGLTRRDITPQTLESTCDYEVPGFGEHLRRMSLEFTPNAILSRGGAWVKQRSLIIALPGSPRAIEQQLNMIEPMIKHALDLLTRT